MKKTLLLIRCNLKNMMRTSRSNKKTFKDFFPILLIILFVFIFIIFFISNYFLILVNKETGNCDFLILVGLIVGILPTIFQNLYSAPSILFGSKDFETLTSFPLKDHEIIISKLSIMYIINLFICFVFSYSIFLPYGLIFEKNILYYIISIIVIIFMPFIGLTFSVFVSFFIGKISGSFTRSNLAMTILTILIIMCSIFFNNLFNNFISEKAVASILINNIVINNIFLKSFISIFKDNNIFFLIIFVILAFAPFILFINIFSKSFRLINSSMNEYFRENNYKLKNLNKKPIILSLILRELKHYLNSFIYLVNTIVGTLMCFVVTFFYITKKEELLKEIGFNNYSSINELSIISLIFISSIFLNTINSSTISLEGNKLWIIKSLPIKTEKILLSKILFSSILQTALLFINIIIVLIFLKINFYQFSVLLFIVILTTLFSSTIYLIINLFFPKLNWKTKDEVVKRGFSVILSLVVGGLCTFASFVILIIININYSEIFFITVLIILNLVLYLFLTKKCSKIFNSLNM